MTEAGTLEVAERTDVRVRELRESDLSVADAILRSAVDTFTGIGTPFEEGACVEVTLRFEKAGEVPVLLSIGSKTAGAPPQQRIAALGAGARPSGAGPVR